MKLLNLIRRRTKYHTKRDSDRAVRRASRWIRSHPGKTQNDMPRHILRNYLLATGQ